jgi:hypothetical protein
MVRLRAFLMGYSVVWLWNGRRCGRLGTDEINREADFNAMKSLPLLANCRCRDEALLSINYLHARSILQWRYYKRLVTTFIALQHPKVQFAD